MDKAVEKIEDKVIRKFLADKRYYGYWNGRVIEADLSDIIAVLEELGYHKVPELPVLSPEEIDQIYFECGILNRPSLNYLNERLVQAQRDADERRLEG